VGDARYTGVRTDSTVIPDCPPGQYIIVPTTFDPSIMDFHMRVWADKPISVIDTRGGRDFQIYDASLDGLDKQSAPLSLGVGEALATEDPDGLPTGSEQTDIIQKHSREETCAMAGMLAGITDGLKRASWKVGELIPRSWQHGDDFLMAPTNTFQLDEITAIMRSDRSIRFAKISEVMGNNTYEVMVAHSPHGSLYKTGVPAQYLGKLSLQGGYPRALVEQIGQIFDLLDADGSGYLEVRPIFFCNPHDAFVITHAPCLYGSFTLVSFSFRCRGTRMSSLQILASACCLRWVWTTPTWQRHTRL